MAAVIPDAPSRKSGGGGVGGGIPLPPPPPPIGLMPGRKSKNDGGSDSSSIYSPGEKKHLDCTHSHTPKADEEDSVIHPSFNLMGCMFILPLYSRWFSPRSCGTAGSDQAEGGGPQRLCRHSGDGQVSKTGDGDSA